MIPTRRAPPATWLLLAAFLSLPGCGSDDDPATEPPVATTASVVAVDDAATVAWNEAATIDVLANDKTSSGALSLSATGTAAHGTASIAGDKLSYTPAAGYIGSDTVTYTVRAADGGATATASVAIAVQAKMRLSGLATDGPIAGAAVTVKVGDAEFSTTADANGNYTVDVTSADPAAFVTVVATGTGAQAGVKLISLVGDVAGLAAKASPAGLVASADVPALNATHLSTALAVLAARATTDGKFPATTAALASATAGVQSVEVLRLATLVRLVADQGVPLPDGATDTLTLLQDKARLDAFAKDQLVNNATAFAAAQASVLSDAPQVGTLGFASNGPQTVAYAFGPLVTYRADGTATVVLSTYGRSEATWREDHGTVTLNFKTPLTQTQYSNDFDPVTNQQNEVQLTYTGGVLRHVSGDSHGGTATWAASGSATYMDGSRKGQSAPEFFDFDGTPYYLTSFTDLDRRLDILPSEVAVGARLGGVSVMADTFYVGRSDILRIVDGTNALFEISGEAATWALADRWLTITGAGGQRVRCARLGVNEATGLEQWLLVAESADGDSMAVTLNAVFAEPAPRFDAASAARVWRFETFYDSDPSIQYFAKLYGDGTGSFDFGGDLRSYTWSIDADGHLVMKEFREGRFTLQRTWIPLKTVNGQHQVLVARQTPDFNTGEIRGPGTYSLQRFADLGPAVKP